MRRQMHNQTENSSIARLFWSRDHDRHWIAYTPATGYVCFPAERDGWHKRRPVPTYGADELREIPARLAFNTGFPMHEAAC